VYQLRGQIFLRRGKVRQKKRVEAAGEEPVTGKKRRGIIPFVKDDRRLHPTFGENTRGRGGNTKSWTEESFQGDGGPGARGQIGTESKQKETH